MRSLLATALGAGIGLGIFAVVVGLTRSRALTLIQRVAPWVSDVSPAAHRVALDSMAKRQTASRPFAERAIALLPQRWFGIFDSSSRVAVLLEQTGRRVPPARWRQSVIEWMLVGACSGIVLGIVAVVLAQGSIAAVAAGALLGSVAGISFKRYVLVREANRQVALMVEELPALCEMLAICLTAGEGFRDALVRITSRGAGPLAGHLRRAVEQNEHGVPLVTALSEMSRTLDVPSVSRVIDHIISSIERGSPLAEVLRTQAADSRSEAGRQLQQRASSREVVMLLPLVFLILPITIAFAIFPGLLVIQSGF